MSQQVLVDETGVSGQTIDTIELGKYAPSLDHAHKIVHVFDVSLENVFE